VNARPARIVVASVALLVLLGAELLFNLKIQQTYHVAIVVVAAVAFHVVTFEAVFSRSRVLLGLVWILVAATCVTMFFSIDRQPALWTSGGLALYTALLVFVLKRELQSKPQP